MHDSTVPNDYRLADMYSATVRTDVCVLMYHLVVCVHIYICYVDVYNSHNLGQNFGTMFNINFEDKDGTSKIPWQTRYYITLSIYIYIYFIYAIAITTCTYMML
jgi:hypothetical protein